MRFKYFLLILFFLGSTLCFGQRVVLKGLVIDQQTQTPISGATVEVIDDENSGTITDAKGFFELKITNSSPALKVSHISYESQTILLTNANKEELIVQLQASFQSLPEIAVIAKRKIDTVFYEPYSVVDYEFSDHHIWLLVHKNSIEKYSLIVLNELEEQVAEISLKDKRPNTLHKDCEGAIFLLTNLYAHQLRIEEEAIVLGERFDVLDYESRVVPCLYATEKFRFYKRYFYQGQAVQYYGLAKEGDLTIDFPMIEDESNLIRLIEDAGCRLPWSGDQWQEKVSYNLEKLRSSEYDLQGWMQILYPKAYNPLLKRDSILSIFNHFQSKLQNFNTQGQLLSEIPISYHQHKKWKKKIFFDERKKLAYTAIHTRWGEAIHSINLSDGTLGPAIPIDKALLENMKAWNGHIYFLYYNIGKGERIRKLHKIYVE